MERKIEILKNSEIDLLRWDSVIGTSLNTRVYAESWYLDIVAPNWLGVIYGDYEYLMPLIWSKKMGFVYLYQPAYVQQNGIFPPPTPAITKAILDVVKKKFSYFDLSVNSMNVIADSQLKIEERKNYILSLKTDYESLKDNYNSHAKRYIRKAHKNCDILAGVDPVDFLNLKNEFSNVGSWNMANLKKIITKACYAGNGVVYGAYSRRNELVAAAFFLIEKKRLTYLNSVSSDEGKSLRAMYAIVDTFIGNHAGKNYLLDFEGSNIEGIARFFKGFGAMPETYQHLHYNNLPWFLKLIKK